MPDIDIQLLGVTEVRGALEAQGKVVIGKLGAALRMEGEIEMTESKRRVPVDTGTLRSSGNVQGPEFSGRFIEVTLGYGGAASAYAVQVHEDMQAFRRTGQPKYLESVVVESAPFMADRVAKRAGIGA